LLVILSYIKGSVSFPALFLNLSGCRGFSILGGKYFGEIFWGVMMDFSRMGAYAPEMLPQASAGGYVPPEGEQWSADEFHDDYVYRKQVADRAQYADDQKAVYGELYGDNSQTLWDRRAERRDEAPWGGPPRQEYSREEWARRKALRNGAGTRGHGYTWDVLGSRPQESLVKARKDRLFNDDLQGMADSIFSADGMGFNYETAKQYQDEGFKVR
jgi:hypothetical protein